MKKLTVFKLCSISLLFVLISLEAKQEKLTIVNDTKKAVRVRYPGKTKEIETKLQPTSQFKYTKGTARIYVPRKGNYEVTISEPRAAGSLNKVTLTQIMEAAKQKEHVGESGYFTEEGKIGDIKIFFEKIID